MIDGSYRVMLAEIDLTERYINQPLPIEGNRVPLLSANRDKRVLNLGHYLNSIVNIASTNELAD